jgi:hypothetical protein
MNATKMPEQTTMTQPAKLLYKAKAHTTEGREGVIIGLALTQDDAMNPVAGSSPELETSASAEHSSFELLTTHQSYRGMGIND